jgi:hypothetical protein
MALTGVHTHNHWGLHDVKFQFGTFSPLLLARILGILGLVGILTGAFDIGYVQSTLIVAGNPSATLHNMLAHETLFRLGVASHLFELALNIPGEIIAFYLFRRVKVIVAAVALCCGVVGIAIEAVDLLSTYVALKLAIEGSAPGAFSPEQLHALSYISAQLQQAGLLLSWVFYGIDELATGFLLFRSGFLPKAEHLRSRQVLSMGFQPEFQSPDRSVRPLLCET